MSDLLRAMQDGLTASMSEDERRRFLAGRHDWPDQRWQDHCGNPDCEQCTGLIPDTKPRTIR